MAVIDVEEAVRRAIECNAMLYNRKSQIAEKDRDQELRYVYQLADLAPDGTAVELGVYWGGSFVCWACARVGRGPLIAVDDWHSKNEKKFRDNIAKYNLDVIVLEMLACEAPAHINGLVAFCFNDACHGETGIPEDIKVWPDKMMAGGVIVFHDYGTKKGVVKREVDAWQRKVKWEKLGRVGSTIAFRKPT